MISKQSSLDEHCYLITMSLGFEPSTQWEAVITHCASTNVPPQNWIPLGLCRSACQVQSPTPASTPPTILEENPLPHPSDGIKNLLLVTIYRFWSNPRLHKEQGLPINKRIFQNFEENIKLVRLELSVCTCVCTSIKVTCILLESRT